MQQQRCADVRASVLGMEAVPPLIAATCDLSLVGSRQQPIGPLGFKCRIHLHRRSCMQDIEKDLCQEAKAHWPLGSSDRAAPNYHITFLFSP